MKKKIIKSIALIISMFLIMTQKVSADDNTMKFNRIYTYMPEIVVEMSNVEITDTSEITAKLGSTQLVVGSAEKFDGSTNTERIFVLLDISEKNSGFENMKNSLKEFVNDSSDNTEIVLYTYGNSITKVLSGGEKRKEINKKIESIKNNDSGSQMYEAICQIYKTYFQEESNYDRQYILLMTSMEDKKVDATTVKEAKSTFLDKSIPVYALVLDQASDKAISQLAEFTRKTGGNTYISSKKKLVKSLTKFQKEINDVTIIKLKASNNIANNKKKLLSITVGENTLSEYVRLINSKKDDVAPKVTAVEGDKAQNAIVVSFSEQISGGKNSYNYAVKDKDGNELKIASVEYSQSELTSYIYMEDKLYNGEYFIEFNGITDNSQDKNALIYDEKYALDNLTNEKSFIQKYYWIFIVAFIVLVLITVVIIVLIKSNKKKKENTINPEKIEELGKQIKINQQQIVNEVGDIYKSSMKNIMSATSGGNVHIKSGKGRKVIFRINMKNRVEQKVEIEIISSIIVGRTAQCELCVDDHNLSRQHFAIEENKGELIISDLNSSNGTFVNGYKLQGRKILRNNDKIMAGATEFIINI